MGQKYIILVEKTIRYDNPYCVLSYNNHRFYSRINGMFCSLENADTYDSFEDAQPKIAELSKDVPEWYFYAIIKP